MTDKIYFTSTTNTVYESERMVLVDDVKCYCWGVRGLALLVDSLDYRTQTHINLLKTLTKELLVPTSSFDAIHLHSKISFIYLLNYVDEDDREYESERLIELKNAYIAYLNMCSKHHTVMLGWNTEECFSVLLSNV